MIPSDPIAMGTNPPPPRAGDGATLSHRAVTFGDRIQLAQLPTSPTSEGVKTSQTRGLPSFLGMEGAVERTLTPWEGQPTQAERHCRQKR